LRVVIERVEPEIDCGRFPVKRVVGDTLRVCADVFTDGHDRVAAVVRFRRAGETSWHEAPMTPCTEPPGDRLAANVALPALGRWEYTVEGWVDRFATWRWALERKLAAGQDVASELREGAALVKDAAGRTGGADA